MEIHRPVRCVDNEDLALYLLRKRQDMAAGLSDNLDATLSNAYRSICTHKNPIKTLKDLSLVKGVGKWILRLMKGFFPNFSDSEASPTKNNTSAAAKTGKTAKTPKRYVPKKSSVAYALLITLYREMAKEVSFMKKQELIDAAEASGLSRTAIGPDKAKGKPGQFGSSPRDWYIGWSCMKTLVSKGLVVKSSCPAKYMLTQEGQEAARDCILRYGLVDSSETLTTTNGSQNSLDERKTSDSGFPRALSADKGVTLPSADLSCQMEMNDTDKRCGLQKLIYLVEGDPNSLETAESIKTACFTTEVLEGFDVQRTTGYADTVRKYGYLTQSIFQYYCTYFSSDKITGGRVCPLFIEFVKTCQDLEKMTVSDVFALQLMQVPQVTEDIALAVIDLHPTLLSLAKAYSVLEGDVHAQEEMLKNQINSVTGVASRNIFKLVWG